MARPQKNGLQKFSLEVDFFSSDTIKALSSEFGLKGEISLVKILCTIFKRGYYLKWNNANKLNLLAQLPGVNDELLRQIVGRLVKWHYFHRELFEQHRILTNQQIQQEYFSLIRRRVVPTKLPYLLIVVNIKGVSADINPVSADINPNNADNNRDYVYTNLSPDSIGIVDPEKSRAVSADIKRVSDDINSIIADINPLNVSNNSVSADINPKLQFASPLSPTPPITSYKEKNNTPKGVFQKKKKGGPPGDMEKEKSCAKKEKATFVPPMPEEVEAYCQKRGLTVNARKFHNYYSAVGWRVGDRKDPMDDWRAKIEEWQDNDKNTRKNESTSKRGPDAHTPRVSGNAGKKGTTGADISDI